MLPYSQKLKYKDVFGGVKTDAAANSQIVLAKDFPVVEFTIYVALTADLANVVGEFEIGETVTGGTSAATGIVYAVTVDSITLTDVVGTFTVMGEAISGGTSGATADLSNAEAPSFTLLAFTSEQSAAGGVENPPDPSLPAGPDNDYTQVVYSDESGGVNYDVDNPYNPTASGVTAYGPKTFRFGTDGGPITGKWVFLKFADGGEATFAGALLSVDINLSNL